MKYTALTIGPILKSLLLAHKTRELWAASFFFSYLMKMIIEKIEDKDCIIQPYKDKEGLVSKLGIGKNKIEGVGIFPDRLFIQSENGMFDELTEIVDNAIKEICGEFGADQSLKEYLSTHIIEFEDKELQGNDKSIPVAQINQYLATCEMQANYNFIDNDCFLKILEQIAQSKIYKSTFKNKGHFPSIIEIATRGLKLEPQFFKNVWDYDEEEIWEMISDQQKENIKTSHKYIAIVQADGDNIVALSSQIAMKGKDKLIEFSKALSSFSLLAAQKIIDYEGTPIYLGGDDFLFFAPVTNSTKNVFQLIEEIDIIFKEQITNKFETEKQPSMSYGVSISYYKYPMHEALKAAFHLLFVEAKNKPKNAIAFRVLKHSGNFFEAVLHKPLNKEFKDLLNKDEGLQINSLIYNFEKHKAVLKEAIKEKIKLSNLFTNFYNEDIHDNSKELLNDVEELLNKTWQSSNKNFDRTIKKVYAQLRLIKFFNSKKDD
jgi:CRISPR-associated protein Cmr2